MTINISIVETGTTVTATEDGANITVSETNVTAAVTSVNGLLEVTHDTTLSGAGTPTSPLSVVLTSLTNLIPAADSTYNIGQAGPTTPRYWANSYIDKMYVRDNAYIYSSAASTIDLVVNVSSTDYRTFQATHNGSNAVLNLGTGATHEFTLTANEANARLELDDASDYWYKSGHIGIGSNTSLVIIGDGSPISSANINIVHEFTGSGSVITAAVISNPSALASVAITGIGGYCIIKGSNFNVGSTVSALEFRNVSWFSSGGSSNLELRGVNIIGAISVIGLLTAGTVYGIRCVGAERLDNVNITTSYGYYGLATAGGSGTLGTEYVMCLEQPISASTNYQLMLYGSGNGSGIWFSGTSDYGRIFSPGSGQLDFAVDNSGETVYLRIDNGAIDLRNHTLGGSASNWSGFGVANIPDTTAGYITVEIDGTNKRIPYYNAA